LFQALLDGVAVCDYIRENIEVSKASTYVFIGDPTYIQGIYNRSLHASGANILDKNSYSSEYRITVPSQEFSNPRVVGSPSEEPLTQQDRKVVEKFLDERISHPASLG
jgi:hypothetical protein